MHQASVAVITAWCKETQEINLFFFVWPDRVRAGEELWLDYGYVSVGARDCPDADLPWQSDAGSAWPLCNDNEGLHDALRQGACAMQ